MMACLNEETLQAYFDCELAPEAAAQVIKHLAECDACASSAFEVERAIELMSSAFEDELPDSVPSERLRARIAAALAGDSAPGDRVRTAAGFWPRILAAPAAALRVWTLSPRGVAYASLAIVALLGILWLGVQKGFFKNESRQADNEKTETPAPAPEVEKLVEPPIIAEGGLDKNENRRPERNNTPKAARRFDRKQEAPVVLVPDEKDDRANLIAEAPRNAVPADEGVFDAGMIQHFEKAQILLRSFRNQDTSSRGLASDIAYERRQSKNLLYRNILLRRDAESRGNLPAEEMLGSLEPVLLDIANLPDHASPDDVRSIKERIHKMEIIGVLQVYSAPSMLASFQP